MTNQVEPGCDRQKLICPRRDYLEKVSAELLAALKAAHAHLDYCGYGDSWERECADASKLDEKITAAIAKAEGQAEQGEAAPPPTDEEIAGCGGMK